MAVHDKEKDPDHDKRSKEEECPSQGDAQRRPNSDSPSCSHEPTAVQQFLAAKKAARSPRHTISNDNVSHKSWWSACLLLGAPANSLSPKFVQLDASLAVSAVTLEDLPDIDVSDDECSV